MEIPITALKAAVAEANRRARAFLARNRLDAAESTYETLLMVLSVLLDADAEQLRGSQRAAYIIADPRQRILLDALAPSRMGELQIRAAALLDLPDQLTVASIDDIHSTIAAAINLGAPRYNAGDVRGCCTIYWATAETLVAAPATRGFPGYARALGQLRAVLEAPPPAVPFGAEGVDTLAWALRNAFDATLTIKG
ncbi:MAG TPA: hypothetical protein VKT52_00025 [Ktedonobacterales bacterium]|nr:hypothetical protein [Ktedonobacterales bacterium]